MKPSEESLNTPGAEEFCPDTDCSTDESVDGSHEGDCALIPEERCTLRCHIRHQEGEAQYNDWLADGTEPPPDLRPELRGQACRP